MYQLTVSLTPQPFLDELGDSRGGRVINLDTGINYNNLHIPYRGTATDFQAPHTDGTGQPLSYMQFLPPAATEVADSALAQAIGTIDHRIATPGGFAAQDFFPGLTFGVGI